MKALTQQGNSTKFGTHSSFDSKSRDSFFKKLNVALQNLSIIERNDIIEKVMLKR